MNRTFRAAGATTAAAVLTVVLAGCGGDALESAGEGTVVVGSAGFTESTILAQLYAQMLTDAGYRTSVKTVNNRELYEPALENGEIDVVPEYAATLAEFLNGKENGKSSKPVASPDIEVTLKALTELAEPRGLKVLPAGEAVDQNAFAVTKQFAEKHGLKTLSDLGRSKLPVKLAGGDECTVRLFCVPGLEERYGIDITGVDPKGFGTIQSKQAVKDGTDQMVITTTTDATLDTFGLVILDDDKNLQNSDNVLPVVNAKDAGDAKIAETLAKITEVLTTEDLTMLNKKVDGEREKPADVAAEYLRSKKMIKN